MRIRTCWHAARLRELRGRREIAFAVLWGTAHNIQHGMEPRGAASFMLKILYKTVSRKTVILAGKYMLWKGWIPR